MAWIEAARRIVDHHGAEVQLPDGSWVSGGSVCDDVADVPEWAEGLDEWEDLQGRRRTVPEGVLLDQFTASMLVQVHDALSEENRAKFAAMPLMRAVSVGWRLVEKTRAA